MSLRTRLVLSAALAVAIAVTGAAFFVYARTRGELHRELDATLRERADTLARTRDRTGRGGPGPRPVDATLPPPPLGGAGGLTQLVDRSGQIRSAPGETTIPLIPGTTDVAAGTEPPFYEDVTVDGTPLRVYTRPFRRGVALQVARPLT
jgi:two-component system, OmpR family, sensor histidine kinase MprB